MYLFTKNYLLECPSLSNVRKKYFEPHFINRPNILKFCNLMNSKSVSILCNRPSQIHCLNSDGTEDLSLLRYKPDFVTSLFVINELYCMCKYIRIVNMRVCPPG